MATYDDMAAAIMKSNMNHEFVWEGDIVELTGRYACPVMPPNQVQTTTAIVATVQVEVKIQDKDAPVTKWMKFSDLKIVHSVTK
jgi:hypothetical protein